MKISRYVSVRFAGSLMAIAGLVGAGGCGDDSLGKGFKPQDKDPPDYGPTSPIAVGTTIYYGLSFTYRPVTGSGEGGLSLPEQQAAGQLCLKVDEVRDTASEAYKDAAKTVIVGRAKVNGGPGASEIDVTDTVNEQPADPAKVDQAQGSLWLRQLTFPQSRGHGFSSPAAVTFDTRTTPRPDAGLAGLPLFEVRKYEGKWRGWTDVLSKMYTGYFIDVLGLNLQDKMVFDQRSLEAPTNCETQTDAGVCGTTPNCWWDEDASKCWGKYRWSLAWREDLSGTNAPAELQGPVVHIVQLEYTTQGILKLAREYILPDVNPSAEVDVDVNECLEGEACATGLVDRDAWSAASCTF